MLSKYFFLMLFLLNASTAFAIDTNNWSKGVIYLNSEDKVWGELSYNQKYDIVQCRTESGIKTFSTHHIKSFRYYDNELQINRHFIVIEEKGRLYRKRGFYEIVMEGTLTMLRKKNQFVSVHSFNVAEYSSDEKEYDYFILMDEGLIKITKFRKEIINRLMQDKSDVVLSYVKDERLSTHKLRDQILIVDYYNTLKGKNSQLLGLK